MPPRHRRFALSLAGAVPAFAVAAALALPASPAAAAYVGGAGTNCFWHYGPFGVGKGKENVAFPEGGSNYWATIYVRPPGAIIRLKGSYPRSRFMSFISYRVAGTPLDGLADYQIKPDAGSTNPFVTGSRRDGKRRSFTVDLIGAPNPGYTLQGVGGLPARNRIYLEDTTPTVEQTPDGPKNLEGMVMRVYLPDRGAGLTGGFQLPEPEVTLANGTRLTGQGACDALDSEAKQHGSPRLPDPNGLRIDLPSYRALRYPDRLAAPCNVLVRGCPTAFTLPDALVQVRRPIPSTFPAANPPVWRGAYDRRYQFQVYTGDRAPGAVPHPVRDPIKNPTRGFFGNIYNAYVEAVINRKFGKVVVLHGRLPTTPKTYGGERTLGPGQLRFYSLCSTEAVVTGVTRFCLNDEQIPTNRRGDFTVVVSRRADRPKTANAAHGIGWLEWSATGDGDLDRDFGRLVIRNLLPRPSFAQALQRGRVAGDEKKVVGPYLPTLAYVKDGAAFDRKAAGR
ncbi:MAG: hypothetical protein U0R70_18870 [Solirubrobacteraceae bacterium]